MGKGFVGAVLSGGALARGKGAVGGAPGRGSCDVARMPEVWVGAATLGAGTLAAGTLGAGTLDGVGRGGGKVEGLLTVTGRGGAKLEGAAPWGAGIGAGGGSDWGLNAGGGMLGLGGLSGLERGIEIPAFEG